MRIGHGYDVHKFAKNRPLIVGGVTIPHSHGLEAHSDGDVLVHAICNTLLGAVGLRDIGHHFPDTDFALKNIDSRILLRLVVSNLTKLRWRVNNIDSTIIVQKPKLAPFIPIMEGLLANDLEISSDAINIKATTTEKLGFVGREEGIAAHAVVLLIKSEDM
ncbi:MAG: 2-C-methyl-D-erythritol 2,4-cyclodiphosphate synthase [Piscirickettsiaceae bacterium]|nr:2-C-methyl-D-erythritol 2,4-cyclodiphosphate synthase [Piscirickettsiaceae bacterium]